MISITIDRIEPTSNSPFVVLSGDRDPTISAVYVDGSSSATTYPAATRWQSEFLLVPGENEIEVVGEDVALNRTSVATVTVTLPDPSTEIHNIFGVLDDYGLELGLPRLPGEKNYHYWNRLLDVELKRPNSSYPGLLHAFARALSSEIDEDVLAFTVLTDTTTKKKVLTGPTIEMSPGVMWVGADEFIQSQEEHRVDAGDMRVSLNKWLDDPSRLVVQSSDGSSVPDRQYQYDSYYNRLTFNSPSMENDWVFLTYPYRERIEINTTSTLSSLKNDLEALQGPRGRQALSVSVLGDDTRLARFLIRISQQSLVDDLALDYYPVGLWPLYDQEIIDRWIAPEPSEPKVVSSSSSSVTTSDTLSWSHTIPGGEHRGLLVSIVQEDIGGLKSVSSVTFNGYALSPCGVQNHQINQVSLWYLLDSDLPAAGTYTVTVTMSASTAGILGAAVSLHNVAQSAPEAFSGNIFNQATSFSSSIATLSPNALVVESLSTNGGNVSYTTDDGQTKHEEKTVSGTGASLAVGSSVLSNVGTHTLGWTLSGIDVPATRLIHVLSSFAPISASGDSHLIGSVLEGLVSQIRGLVQDRWEDAILDKDRISTLARNQSFSFLPRILDARYGYWVCDDPSHTTRYNFHDQATTSGECPVDRRSFLRYQGVTQNRVRSGVVGRNSLKIQRVISTNA